MNDDATREMPVLNIADVTDMPTQTLPVHEPAHESTRKPANTQSVHAETAPAEPAHTESAHPQSARPHRTGRPIQTGAYRQSRRQPGDSSVRAECPEP